MKKYIRILATMFIVCAIGFGLYTNFSDVGQNSLPVRAIMVTANK